MRFFTAFFQLLRAFPLTLAQEHVLREVPEGRLHHVEVAAAHAVHERGQEVSRQAAKVKKTNK